MKSVLIASEKQEAHDMIWAAMGSNYQIKAAKTRDAALRTLNAGRCDFVFIDLAILHETWPVSNYKTALQQFWHLYPSIRIIVMSSQEKIRDAVMTVKAGASNYLTYPISSDEVRHVTETIHESIILQSELNYLRDQFWQEDSSEIVRTSSPIMKKVFKNIKSVAPTKSTVLLNGETGTGKGVLSRLIHQHSNRKEKQFISVHCGAIPDTLLESELFGHEKGAFTGAARRKLGKFEIAREGTIFLDEIATITPSAQIKLLQILQEGFFSRIGGEDMIEANVRIITAANTDLKKMCNENLFRSDLYYRLNVFPIEVPPLRERREDIPIFAELFIKRLNKYYAKEIYDIHPQVMDAFIKYEWPGNIRELENLIERGYILETSSVLTPESIPNELFEPENQAAFLPVDSSVTLAEARLRGIADIERCYLKEVLSRNKGKINKSAEEAGISTRQLNKLMKKYGIRKEEFKYRLPDK